MMLGLDRPFLFEITGTVADQMSEAYSELEEKREHISRLTLHEEERFMHALRIGLPLVEDELAAVKERKETILPGEKIFKLYDTYGVPFDLLAEMAEEKGVLLDEEGFQREMEGQRARARGSSVLVSAGARIEAPGYPLSAATEFTGYESLRDEATVRALLREGKPLDEAEAPSEVEMVLDRTPFYAESGGQVGDRGWITWDGGKAEVLDTSSQRGLTFHRCQIKRGKVHLEEKVSCQVRQELRQSTANHHTATHILHAALRQVLGDHVKQSGSLVAPERLRFDFSHFSPLRGRELQRVEELANEHIRSNISLCAEEKPLDEALASGAMAIFGEKYGDRVRVVSVPGVSMELCGGTHVRATGELGLLKIVSEGGIAAGIRRIEAVAGRKAWELVKGQGDLIEEMAERLKVKPPELLAKIDKLLGTLKEQENAMNRIQDYLALQKRDELLREKKVVNGMEVVSGRVDFLGPRELRRLSDLIKDRIENGAIVLAASTADRVHWVVGTCASDRSRLHAGTLVNEVARITGGKGGGRVDLAEGSGRLPEKIDQALASVPSIIRRLLSGPGQG
jgi:alanyl-tRNA synthetase